MIDFASVLAEVVAGDPDSIAVLDSDGKLTYAELDNWSNELGRRIIDTVGPDPKVCLVVSGFDRLGVVGMAAVLKTPQIFVALDCETPPGNIARIAEELDAGLCLFTGRSEAGVLAAGLSVQTIRIATPPEGPVSALPALPDLSRVAFCRRTTGSTGGAKTLAFSAEAMLTSVANGMHLFETRPDAPRALVSTFDSTMAIGGMMRSLLSGETIMPVDLRFETPREASDRLIETGVTHIRATPTAFHLLAQGLREGGIFRDFCSVALGGEKTTQADVRLVSRTTKPECRLQVTYGSTETQFVANNTVVPADDPDPEDFTALTVLPGVKVDIIGENGETLPAGAHGRIRVTSRRVALGYRGNVDPAFNAKFSLLDDGPRSYLTDDVGYLNEENRLVITSRTGREVKIRGRRVELAEVEDWLTAQDGIIEAAVVPQPIGPEGDLRLAAFIKVDEKQFKGVTALRKQMQSHLIAAMRPTAIVLVDGLPRTPGQKIDRKVLESDLSHLDAVAEEDFQADGLVGQIAEIWGSLLNRKIAGPDANFFDLGGDSIAATVTALQIEEKLGVRVDAGFVYRFQTLSEQSRALEDPENACPSLLDPLLVPLTNSSFENLASDSGSARVFVISGAGGHVFPFAPLAEELVPDWDLIGILHPGILESEPKLDSVEAYADRMHRAIKTLQPSGPYFIMGYSFGGAVAHEIGRRISEAGEKTGVVVLDMGIPRLVPLPGRARLGLRRAGKRVRHRLSHETPSQRSRVDWIDDLDDPDLNPSQRARQKFSMSDVSPILKKYRPGKSASPTVLIKAAESPHHFATPDLNWSRIVPLMDVVIAPGNHLNLFKEPYLKGFADLMRMSLKVLDEISSDTSGPRKKKRV